MAGNEMKNGFDPEMQYAALGERVEGQGRRLSGLEQKVDAGFSNVQVSIAGLANEFRSSQRPQWQAIGVALTFAALVGALAYWPIRENQSDAKIQMRDISMNALSVAAFQDFKATYENNRVVSRTEYIDKFQSVNSAIGKINDAMVPRAELERIWQLYDGRFAEVQRQIDRVDQIQSGQYNQRDLNRDTLERLDRLERATRPFSGTP